MESAGVRFLRTSCWILLLRCAPSFDFWYKNNMCVYTVQSTFHSVLCLFYTYWDIHPFGGLFILNLSKMLKFAVTHLQQNDNENEVSAFLVKTFC